MLRVTPLVVLLTSALLAPAAHAQTGLYQPFPGSESTGLTKRYLRQLPGPEAKALAPPEIQRGVFVARPRGPAIGAASVRAGLGGDGGGSLPPVLSLGIVGLAAGGGFALASRRR
jgi:hypothetical protein